MVPVVDPVLGQKVQVVAQAVEVVHHQAPTLQHQTIPTHECRIVLMCSPTLLLHPARSHPNLVSLVVDQDPGTDRKKGVATTAEETTLLATMVFVACKVTAGTNHPPRHPVLEVEPSPRCVGPSLLLLYSAAEVQVRPRHHVDRHRHFRNQ